MKGINLTTILLIAVSVLATLQIRSCFNNVQKPEQMIRNEVELKHLQEENAFLKSDNVKVRAMYDSSIAASVERSNQLQNKFQQTKIIYEKVPVIVNNLNNEDLRRAVTEYGK